MTNSPRQKHASMHLGALLALARMLSGTMTPAAVAKERPNILCIMADNN